MVSQRCGAARQVPDVHLVVAPTGHLQANVNKAINIQERSDCTADDCSYTGFDMIQQYDGG